jgi:hypothetical protein
MEKQETFLGRLTRQFDPFNIPVSQNSRLEVISLLRRRFEIWSRPRIACEGQADYRSPEIHADGLL